MLIILCLNIDMDPCSQSVWCVKHSIFLLLLVEWGGRVRNVHRWGMYQKGYVQKGQVVEASVGGKELVRICCPFGITVSQPAVCFSVSNTSNLWYIIWYINWYIYHIRVLRKLLYMVSQAFWAHHSALAVKLNFIHCLILAFNLLFQI